MIDKQENKKLNLHQLVRKNKAFCIMPFNHSYVTTNGNANLCCVADFGNPIETDMSGKNLIDVFRGDEYKRIRQGMIDGVMEPRCFLCYKHESTNPSGSDRQSHNERYLKELGDNYIPDVDAQFPTWADLRPGRMCNFGCRMCWRAISTTIDIENRAHPETAAITFDKPVDVDEWIDDPVAFESVKEMVPHMTVLKLAGGEPLFMPGVIKLLRWCVDSGNTHLILDITTNGSRTKGKVLKLIQNFRNVNIQFSMCGVGYTNDYIRYGADWNELDEAYRQYMNAPGINTHLLSTAQFYNVYDLVNVIKYWAKVRSETTQDIEHNNILFNLVNFPDDEQFDILPKDERLRVADELEQVMNEHIPVELRAISSIENIISRLRLDFDEELITSLRKRLAARTVMYDNIRQQDIALVHPELARLCKQWQTI